MLTFFDYLYYCSCKFYEKRGGSNPKYTGIIIVSAMHGFNILSVFFLLNIITAQAYLNKLFVFILFIGLFILNGIRYTKGNYDEIKEKWDSQTINEKKKKTAIIIGYIIFSTTLVIVLAIYLGSIKKNSLTIPKF